MASFKKLVRYFWKTNKSDSSSDLENSTSYPACPNEDLLLASPPSSNFMEPLSVESNTQGDSYNLIIHPPTNSNFNPVSVPNTPHLPLIAQPLHLNSQHIRRKKIHSKLGFSRGSSGSRFNSGTLNFFIQNFSASNTKSTFETNQFENLLDHFTILNPLLHSDSTCMTYSVLKHSTLQVNTARIFKKISSYETTIEYRQRLQREITLTSQLEHANILKLNDVYLHSELHFIITDGGYFSGTGLLSQNVPFDTGVALFWDLIDGLNYLHNLGLAHLDLSLENLAIFYEGKLKIANLGRAVITSPHKPNCIPRVGWDPPNSYTAPELVSNRNTVTNLLACDIWAAGVLGFVFFSGRLPWKCASSNDPAYQWYASSPVPIYLANPQATRYAKLLTNMLSIPPNSRVTASISFQHLYALSSHSPDNIDIDSRPFC